MKRSLIYSSLCIALLLAVSPFESRGCTSWMVFSDFTKNGTHILHKNRDSNYNKIAAFMSLPSSPRKWISLGNSQTGINSGVNTSGLAGAMNSGEPCIAPTKDRTKKSTPDMMHAILESCDTAKQAVAKLKSLVDAGDYWHGKSGSIFFFCDTKEGYICEITAKHLTAQRYTRGYTVRANIWQNPNMYELSRNKISNHLNSSARAYMAIHLLNTALDTHQKITLTDIFAASRHCKMPEDCPQKRSLCGKKTNSGSSVEVDLQYPDVLSAMYVTIGPPRNTVYIPIPVCAEKLHPAIRDFSWSANARKRFDKQGFDAPVPENWIKFEKDSVAKFAQAKAKARQLLKAGKRTEAVKLLNSTAEKIWNDAAKLLAI